jgi:hypothetical protein
MPTNNADNFSNPIAVSNGGQGNSSLTAYAVLCGGTTSTGALQSIAGVGSANQVLTSNGAGALPTFQALSGTSALTLVSAQSASASSSLTFTSIGSNSVYLLCYENMVLNQNSDILELQMSNNNGSSYITSGYQSGIVDFNYNSTMAINTSSTSAFVIGPSVNNTLPRCASFFIYNCSVGTYPHISGLYTDASNTGYIMGVGGSTGMNAFKILPVSSTIATGDFKLYALQES